MASFSITESFRFGWSTFKAQKKFLIVLTLLIVLIQNVPIYLLNSIENLPWWVSITGFALLFLFQTMVTIGTLTIYLAIAGGSTVGYPELFVHRKKIIPYVIGSLLYGCAVLVGLLLFVVPGVILSVRLQFWTYVLVDKGVGPVAALKESWRITKRSTVNTLLFNILVFLVSLLGILIFIVGIFVTIPLVALASVWVYRTLSQASLSRH